ncbi:MAG: multicopper oxidase domain-containing protein [Rhodospirillaceae bacterium]|nr:multicopper oxidase domain-containing protein [Rhodospirillaceae bacterium]
MRAMAVVFAAMLTSMAASAAQPAALRPSVDAHGNAVHELGLRYVEGTLYDPMTGRNDRVRLRSYVGASGESGATAPFVAPLIEARPGQTLRLKLVNDLPADDPSCADPQQPVNDPHCYNTTNLHMHGFWVSPSGNSDNVLLSIGPGASFEYEYAIPADHPSGTYFYHTHHHGSTALQVSSGMAGAVIVRGDRLPRRGADGILIHGDLDTLLKAPDGAPFAERILVLQQIPYACRDQAGKVKADAAEHWICGAGEVGAVEGYDLFGQSTWDRSGRFTGINGDIVPTFNGARAGAIERWRVVHGGVRDSATLEFRKLAGPKPESYRAASADERRAYVEKNCTGPIVPVLGVALDGLTRRRAVEQAHSSLQPGYRQDLLVTFPEPGVYCVIDDEAAAIEKTGANINDRELLAYVEVGDGPGVSGGDVVRHMRAALVAAARAHMPADVRDSIADALARDLSLTAFTDHADIADAELTGEHTLGLWYFNTKIGENEADFQHEIGELGRSIDGKLVLKNPLPYDPARIDRVLTLGGADEWTLSSFWGGHPFHIHVNPFQIVSIVDPEGRDVSGPGSGQFANLKGEWKDTLFIEQGYVVTVRMRYERYIGDFVLHCHILDHEDKGMMQNVRIAPPRTNAPHGRH